MVRQDEEDRASAFRARLKRREAAEEARNRSLAGTNSAAAQAIRDGWEPILLARIEREDGYAPEEDD